jgi:hypothetical protein
MPDSWHSINDPGNFFKPKPAPADNTRVAYKTDPISAPKKEPTPNEVRLSEGTFLPPDGGLKFNDKCKIQVKVEYLRETSLKKITFSLFCIYNGKTEEMKPDKEGFEKDGIAETEFQLFYPEDYKQGDKADFFFKASHLRGEKVVESEKLTVPTTDNDIFGFPEEVTDEIPLEDAQNVAIKITEEYEGGEFNSLSGDSDGQGISWGIMQWNFGQSTLAPLLIQMKSKDEDTFKQCFNNDLTIYSQFCNVITQSTDKQLEWARSVQTKNHIEASWKAVFDAIANVQAFQDIQTNEAISTNHKLALDKIEWLRQQFPVEMSKITLRTYVALFDLSNQHRRLKTEVQNKLLEDWQKTKPTKQFEIIKQVAIERGIAARSAYRADSISRRLGILYAKPMNADSNINSQITTSSTRENDNFTLIEDNKVISGL